MPQLTMYEMEPVRTAEGQSEFRHDSHDGVELFYYLGNAAKHITYEYRYEMKANC